MTRAEIRKLLKLSDGLNPDKEDSGMSDAHYNTAIEEATKQLALDCNLIPVRRSLPLDADVYEYAIPPDLERIRSMWFIDSNGNRNPMRYVTPEDFLDFVNPTDTAETPYYYSYPVSMNEVMQFYVQAAPVEDYTRKSYITEQTIRTLVDTGANFGKTLTGERIKPGFIVNNLSDGSYGYVQVLDINSSRSSGTATSGTNTTTLEDTTKNFSVAGVSVGDIICTPSTGLVMSYAFVTAVSTTKLTYESIQGNVRRFEAGDTYKVGIANEIYLSLSTPHPGLRMGARNYFSVVDSGITIMGTTFTNTRCVGTLSGTPSTGQIAIASSGKHGKITAVSTTYVDVDKWIGGLPSAGEAVNVKICDLYSIEDNSSTVKALWIGPTPSSSSAIGSSSIEIMFNKVPEMPDDDTDPIQVPERYKQLLLKAAKWQVAFLSGNYDLATITGFENLYKYSLANYAKDIYAPPMGHTPNLWRNQNNATQRRRPRWDVSRFK